MVFSSGAGAQSPGSGSSQQTFSSAQAAAEALVEACKNNDTPALVRMLGEEYGKRIEKIDDAEERRHRRDFYEKAQAQLKIEAEGGERAVIVVGREQWPVPVPLVKEASGWRFDTAAGMEEMLARRIGENELAAIEVCYEYPRWQADYAAVDVDGDAVREFAQRFVSSEGKRDGLYWEVSAGSGERPSPLQALVPDYFGALKESKPGRPYMGYYFRILTRQGEHAPGGKYDYVINGNMIAGYALVAWPADYRESGVMTFLISHTGRLYEKDLGAETAKLAAEISEYNPDSSWKAVEVE